MLPLSEVAAFDASAPVRWDDAEALKLPFNDFLRACCWDGTALHHEQLYCAYYGAHSRKYFAALAKLEREKRKEDRLARRQRRIAFQKWRRRRRQPVQWNQKNRHRRAISYGKTGHCVRYLVGVLRRGGKGALVPLIFAVGPLGRWQRKEYHLNAVERAWRACFRTEKVPCCAVQKRIAKAAMAALAGEHCEFVQKEGVFLGPLNINDPFTRDTYRGKKRNKNDNIPPGGGGVKKVAFERSGRIADLGKIRRALAWKASRAALQCASRHFPGCAVRFSFRHVYAWLSRYAQRGYDLRELVRLYRDDNEENGIFMRWESRARDAYGTGWQPSGLIRDLSREVEASLEPFWSMMNAHGAARRAKRRAQIAEARAFVMGGSHPFAEVARVENEANG